MYNTNTNNLHIRCSGETLLGQVATAAVQAKCCTLPFKGPGVTSRKNLLGPDNIV
jgi:hypothetical protein